MLYRRGRDSILRRAVSKEEAGIILAQCHEGVFGGHFAEDTTARKILAAGYFWPSLFKDCSNFCKSCPMCQAYGKRLFSHTELNPIFPTGPFEKWGVDFVGPLPKTQRRNQYLIVATDYLTKWAEATLVHKADKHVAAEFIFNQVVCRYGCPLEIITDQGSHFANEVVKELLDKLSVKHRRASPYYPQANGLVEKTNGILAGIIAKVVQGERKQWDLHVGDALWSYRTAYKLTTGFTTFQLTFGFEAVNPVEYEIPSLRLAVQHELGDSLSLQARLLILEKLDEFRRRAHWCNEVAQKKKKASHDSVAKTVTFARGSLVMLVVSWLMKQHGQKFIPKWKGPYVVHMVFDNGTYELSTPEGSVLKKRYNGSKLKVYRHLDFQA
jgi:hypothetical protein